MASWLRERTVVVIRTAVWSSGTATTTCEASGTWAARRVVTSPPSPITGCAPSCLARSALIASVSTTTSPRAALSGRGLGGCGRWPRTQRERCARSSSTPRFCGPALRDRHVRQRQRLENGSDAKNSGHANGGARLDVGVAAVCAALSHLPVSNRLCGAHSLTARVVTARASLRPQSHSDSLRSRSARPGEQAVLHKAEDGRSVCLPAVGWRDRVGGAVAAGVVTCHLTGSSGAESLEVVVTTGRSRDLGAEGA